MKGLASRSMKVTLLSVAGADSMDASMQPRAATLQVHLQGKRSKHGLCLLLSLSSWRGRSQQRRPSCAICGWGCRGHRARGQEEGVAMEDNGKAGAVKGMTSAKAGGGSAKGRP